MTANRVTFANAIIEAYRPTGYIYALELRDGGHGLNAAHCIETCPTPGECECAEITHLDWETISSTWLLAREHGALCHTDLEHFCHDDADKLLQVALWGTLQLA